MNRNGNGMDWVQHKNIADILASLITMQWRWMIEEEYSSPLTPNGLSSHTQEGRQQTGTMINKIKITWKVFSRQCVCTRKESSIIRAGTRARTKWEEQWCQEYLICLPWVSVCVWIDSSGTHKKNKKKKTKNVLGLMERGFAIGK